MKVWAIADLHLSFGVKNKKMDVFGPKWYKHDEKIKKNWLEVISDQDLVLIAGDISWGLTMEEALHDLEWIDRLPGTKLMCKGNHDLWWSSISKVRNALPKSIHVIHNDSYTTNNLTIGGARLWENRDIRFDSFIEFCCTPGVEVKPIDTTEETLVHDEKIYRKEVNRLNWSLDSMDKRAETRIAMVHYPPTGPDHHETEITRLMDNESIDYCLYGHLHNLKEGAPLDFTLNKTKYICTACDWLDFRPYLVCSL